MPYYVVTSGQDGVHLFLVDRKKTKKSWWTVSLDLAMEFDRHLAAMYSANRLRYKDPRVVGSVEAGKLEDENTQTLADLDVHPFSSEGLGQE